MTNNNLSVEEKNTLIAVACGQADRWVIVKRGMYYRPKACGYTYNIEEAWIVTEAVADQHVYPRGDEPVTKRRAPLLDYFNDLNACHEMEKTVINEGLAEVYAGHLGLLVEQEEAKHEGWQHANVATMLFCFAHATASQRAKAFSRTLKLW